MSLPKSLALLLALTAGVQAAPQGKTEYRQGIRYLKGDGVTRDYSTAVDWIRKGAEKGYDPARYALARLLLKGMGVKRSEAEAVLWLQRAHASGYKKATAKLKELGKPLEAPGAKTAKGKPDAYPVRPPIHIPVKPDAQIIREMLVHLKVLTDVLNEPLLFRTKLNAKRGSPFHQFHMGYLHETGQHLKKDARLARSWYSKAASGGYPPAQAFLRRLERRSR